MQPLPTTDRLINLISELHPHHRLVVGFCMSTQEKMRQMSTTELITPPTAPVEKKNRLVIVIMVALTLVIVGLVGYAAHQHSELTKSQAHSALITKSLATTKDNLSTTKSKLVDSDNQLNSANTTLSYCSEAMEIGRHMNKAVYALSQALNADLFTKYTYLSTALSQTKAVQAVLDRTGYTRVQDLYDDCDGGSGINS